MENVNPLRAAYRESTDKFLFEKPTRRSFLSAAPSVAAALSFAANWLFTTNSGGQSRGTEPAAAFQLITAQAFQNDMKFLHQKPGSTNLMNPQTSLFTAVLTVEVGYSEKEFEWHENCDHLFQIIEGATIYEIGGTPRAPRMTAPGEWRASDSRGAIDVALQKGDILLIPRGTPHRQRTVETVTFILISPVAREELKST